MPLAKNSYIDTTITSMTSQGSGVARHEGMAVFVPGSAVGDRLRVKILKVLSTKAYGKIEEIIAPSEDRTEPDCAVFGKCGGCDFRHITYEAELRLKWERVAQTLKRIGGVDVQPEPIIGAEQTDRYRNKTQYPVDFHDKKINIGFFAPRSHRIINCADCLLQPQSFTDILAVFREYIEQSGVMVYDQTTHAGLLRNIYLRKAFATGEIMVCPVINGKTLPDFERLLEQLKSVDGFKTLVCNINTGRTNVILGEQCKTLYGRGYITDELCGLRFNISPLSFYQVNSAQAQKLYTLAGEMAEPQGKTVLDLYCGTGTISLTMAQKAKQIIGVEIIPQAVQDAKQNALINGVTNARFICDDAKGAAAQLAGQGIKADAVIIDPPRKGCDVELIETVATRLSPERVVYVSCDPATLARDMKAFGLLGYKTVRVVPVDMFARTAHVECVCLLSGKKR